MTSLTTLRDLRERCQKATGPDRGLDCDILVATAESPFVSYYPDCVLASLGGFAARVEIKDVPVFTASLDAAVALVERVCPAKKLEIGIYPSGCRSQLRWYPDGLRGEEQVDSASDGETPALSVVGAILSALIAQHEAAHEHA